jgi:hypothetical protein
VEGLRSEDAITLYNLMEPARVTRRARELDPLYGGTDPVMGAWAAYRELRGLVRAAARKIAAREGKPLAGTGFAMAMRAMGYVGRFQPVNRLKMTDWREAAPDVLGAEIAIPGGIWVDVGHARQRDLNLACFRAISDALVRLPWLNRARLQERIYERTSGEIMVHTSPALDIVRSVILNPSAGGSRSTWNLWSKALRGMKRAEDHWLRPLSTYLLRAWCRAGFIASPAGAMISPVGDTGVEFGWPPLIPGNGVPLAISICRPVEGKAFIGVRPDHRVLDAPHLGPLYQHLKEEIPRWLRSSSKMW